MDARIDLVKADITTLNFDAIVNAANSTLLGGSGVDGAIHKAAGHRLLEECKSLNGCNTGDAKITKGYKLPARFVIHTVGPVWHGGDSGEEQMLGKCYKNSLTLAVKHGIKTIAFPSISTGAYGFPIEKAAKIALKEINNFLETDSTLTKVAIICFSDEDMEVYQSNL